MITQSYLDFETQIAELEGKIQDLRQVDTNGTSVNIDDEIKRLENKVGNLLKDTYSKLSPWQKTLVSRHPNRPHFQNYLEELIADFTPLAGDRLYGEDKAIIAGLGRFKGRSIAIIGQEKGHDTESRLKHNFGMAEPEGYRKAIRIMKMAEDFDLPVITLADTPGAYPGIGAEERGQAEAIARSTQMCLKLGVPIISVIIGEGMSGGAVSIASANRVYMLEHSIYSVISPEACSSILWRSADRAKDAAAGMKLTAQHLHELKVIDDIIPEPVGGAHRAPLESIERTGDVIEASLKEFASFSADELRQQRREKFLAIGRTEFGN